jgi:hypothetical protein
VAFQCPHEKAAMPRSMTPQSDQRPRRQGRVVVTGLRENTFLATIHLTVKGEQVAVDARQRRAR